MAKTSIKKASTKDPIKLKSVVDVPVIEKETLVKSPDVSIVMLSTSPIANGVAIFGLGDDQRIYGWNYEHAAWVPNWQTS